MEWKEEEEEASKKSDRRNISKSRDVLEETDVVSYSLNLMGPVSFPGPIVPTTAFFSSSPQPFYGILVLSHFLKGESFGDITNRRRLHAYVSNMQIFMILLVELSWRHAYLSSPGLKWCDCEQRRPARTSYLRFSDVGMVFLQNQFTKKPGFESRFYRNQTTAAPRL